MKEGTRISILMCSYNGDSLLPVSVPSICNLNVSLFDYVEFVFVDNGSIKDLRKIVSELWESHSTSIVLKLLLEEKKGKIPAFKTGFNHCVGEYVIVCDDDNELSPEYIIEGVHYLQKHPLVGVLGGNGMPASSFQLPAWFSDWEADFACGKQAKYTGNVYPGKNVVYGAGMWFRKELLQIAFDNGFDFIFNYIKDGANIKKRTNGGEDGELCWAIKYQGYEIHFLEHLCFNHHISDDKLTSKYLELLSSRKGHYSLLGQIYWRVYHMDRQKVSNFWIKEFIHLLFNYFKDLKWKKQYLFEETTRVVSNLKMLILYRSKYDAIINNLLNFKNKF
jgi:glycosyltransferase involved in cell wall biosynthesis